MSAPDAAAPADVFTEKLADVRALIDLVWLSLAGPDDDCSKRGLMLASGLLAEVETAGRALVATTTTN